MHYLLPPDGKPADIAPSLNRIKRGVGTDSSVEPSPAAAPASKAAAAATPEERGNPTVMPRELLSRFHFAFLIRDPHYSVPSYYRCTIAPLDDVTGFHYYDPSEAGYDELRRTFDYLRRERLIGPHIATREQDADELEGRLKPVGAPGSHAAGDEICVIDADDLLDKPAAMIEAFCRSVGIEYDPSMLDWDNEADQKYVNDAFDKWRGFHNDVIESKGLMARTHVSSGSSWRCTVVSAWWTAANCAGTPGQNRGRVRRRVAQEVRSGGRGPHPSGCRPEHGGLPVHEAVCHEGVGHGWKRTKE